MLKSLILILALASVSCAYVCDQYCGIYYYSIQCYRGYRPVFAQCNCCVTCEKVLLLGNSCVNYAEPAAISRENVPNAGNGVPVVTRSYPRCAQGLYCNEYTHKCEYING